MGNRVVVYESGAEERTDIDVLTKRMFEEAKGTCKEWNNLTDWGKTAMVFEKIKETMPERLIIERFPLTMKKNVIFHFKDGNITSRICNSSFDAKKLMRDYCENSQGQVDMLYVQSTEATAIITDKNSTEIMKTIDLETLFDKDYITIFTDTEKKEITFKSYQTEEDAEKDVEKEYSKIIEKDYLKAVISYEDRQRYIKKSRQNNEIAEYAWRIYSKDYFLNNRKR